MARQNFVPLSLGLAAVGSTPEASYDESMEQVGSWCGGNFPVWAKRLEMVIFRNGVRSFRCGQLANCLGKTTLFMENPPLLVLGTGNRKKRLELEQLLVGMPVRIATLADFPPAGEVEETGTTFAENAALKASQQAVRLGHWVLAEDSGLSVEALGGAPGVISARYAGLPSNDERNNAKLMAELAKVPLERRHAWYTCHACLANPLGEIVSESVGECHGRIVIEPRGVSGFGYDPYFEIPEYHLTFAELGLEVKGVLSHRARAMRQMLPKIRRHLNLGDDG